MSVFDEVKAQVTARRAAEFYGIRVNRHGFAVCPFHDDKNPSMKLDSRFHCFGCGADGDAIDLVSRLYGLTSMDAVKKMVDDFALGIQISGHTRSPTHKVRTLEMERAERQRAFDQWVRETILVLTDYLWMLREWRTQHAPRGPDEDLHPLYLLAVQREPLVEGWLDILMSGGKEEQIELYEHIREEVNMIGRQLEQYRRGSGRAARGDHATSSKDGR